MANVICASWEGRVTLPLVPVGQWGLPHLSDTHIYIIILFFFGGHPPKEELGSRPHYDFEL